MILWKENHLSFWSNYCMYSFLDFLTKRGFLSWKIIHASIKKVVQALPNKKFPVQKLQQPLPCMFVFTCLTTKQSTIKILWHVDIRFSFKGWYLFSKNCQIKVLINYVPIHKLTDILMLSICKNIHMPLF